MNQEDEYDPLEVGIDNCTTWRPLSWSNGDATFNVRLTPHCVAEQKSPPEIVIYKLLKKITTTFEYKSKSSNENTILPPLFTLNCLVRLIYSISVSNISDSNVTSCPRLLIAPGAWFSWFSISESVTEKNAFLHTLITSFQPIVSLLMSLYPIIMGFIRRVSLMFGVSGGNHVFTTPACTAKTLYAVWSGDEVLDVFAEIYMYSCDIPLIGMAFNIGLAIVEYFFMTTPRLEAPDDKPATSLKDLIKTKNAKEAKGKAEIDSKRKSKNAIKRVYNRRNMIQIIQSNSYYNICEGMGNEFNLNIHADAFAIFSNIHASFDLAVSDQNGNNKQTEVEII